MRKPKIISLLASIIVLLSIIVFYQFTYTTLHLSPEMCEISLDGVSPKYFCDNGGSGTWLEGKYLKAKTDADGCLIITLKKAVISEWKNTFVDLQILQCVCADRPEMGINVDYSRDFLSYMENAHTCGFEISENFTRVIDSPDDNTWYYPIIVPACARMQMFEGKSCSEIKVEYIEINESGEIINTVIFPDDADSFMSIK